MEAKDTRMAKRIDGEEIQAGIGSYLLDDKKDHHFRSNEIMGYTFYATDSISVAQYLKALG